MNNSLHLGENMLEYFSADIMFRKSNSFPRARCEHQGTDNVQGQIRGTDNVQGQISEHILSPSGGYFVYYTSKMFLNTHGFENWGISSNIPLF